ncbi:LytTR family DNA-binding domain-containing protein [Ruminococcaceae bacterium OttesenSCG-928-I18]|nr:LytTR family DNA-binding domain-containing protein [Ruminococcaceae bacterium OttesenSCG-928-I18]
MTFAICDDDITFATIFAKKLDQQLKRYELTVEIVRFYSSAELLDEVKFHPKRFDVFFLDIEMPQVRGTTLAKELRQLDSSCKIVFITLYDAEIFNAFHYKADAFIPKTIIDDRLSTEIACLLESLQQTRSEDYVFFDVEMPKNSRHANLDLRLRLYLSDILFFESSNRKVLLHAEDATYTVKGVNWKRIRDDFKERGFIEAHRCILLNPKHIKAVGKQEVLLDNEERIGLSRRYHKTVLGNFMHSLRG